MARPKRAKPTETITEPPVSVLIGCTEHGQTVQMVVDRWAQVAEMTKDRARDLTCCHHCSGPAKFDGISAMSYAEIRNVEALCTKCTPKEATE